MATDNLTDPEQRFVTEFMVDRDPYMAALRAGVAKINVKRTVTKWMSDQRILHAIKLSTDSTSIEDMISPQRIVAGWMDVAFNPNSPPAAKNAALRELATIRKMYEDDEKNKQRSGVMLVPMPGTLDDWAALALEAQTKLKSDVRD